MTPRCDPLSLLHEFPRLLSESGDRSARTAKTGRIAVTAGDLGRRFFDSNAPKTAHGCSTVGKRVSHSGFAKGFDGVPPHLARRHWPRPGFDLSTCTVQFPSGPIRQAPGEFENLLPKLRWNPRPNLHEPLQISVN
jgi:hypothetical protein